MRSKEIVGFSDYCSKGKSGANKGVGKGIGGGMGKHGLGFAVGLYMKGLLGVV